MSRTFFWRNINLSDAPSRLSVLETVRYWGSMSVGFPILPQGEDTAFGTIEINDFLSLALGFEVTEQSFPHGAGEYRLARQCRRIV